jgi:hypothetical protein
MNDETSVIYGLEFQAFSIKFLLIIFIALLNYRNFLLENVVFLQEWAK